jgi:hypothetical protein
VSAARTAAVSEAFIACVVAQPNVFIRKKVTSCSVTTDRISGSAGPVDASECRTSTPRRFAAATTAACSANRRRPRWPSSNGKWTIRAKSRHPSARSAAAPRRVVNTVSSSSGKPSASAGARPRRYVSVPPEPAGSRNSALRPT